MMMRVCSGAVCLPDASSVNGLAADRCNSGGSSRHHWYCPVRTNKATLVSARQRT